MEVPLYNRNTCHRNEPIKILHHIQLTHLAMRLVDVLDEVKHGSYANVITKASNSCAQTGSKYSPRITMQSRSH
jgi:hypothetical protein